jgi:hypothetical protein
MKRIALIGFAIWLLATLALRLIGRHIFDHPLVLLAVSLPAMILVARAVLAHAPDRTRGAIALVAPGMLLDAIARWRSTACSRTFRRRRRGRSEGGCCSVMWSCC